MDSNTATPNCVICELRHLSEPAEVWCNDCEEGLCRSCKDHHSLSRSSRNHNTIQVTEYLELPSFVLNIKQHCELHEEHFQMFCKIHNCPCCRKCIVETHNTCKELAVLGDIIGNVKTSTSFVELDLTVKEIASNVQKILINRAKNLTNLEEQKEKIKSGIRNKKQQFIRHLEKLEKDLIRELHEKAEKEQRQIQEYIQLVNEKEKEILDFHITLEKMKQHASNLQCFLASKQMELRISAIEEFLYSDDKTEILFDRSLNVKYDNTMSDIQSLIKTLGTISLDAKPSELDIKMQKHKQAQLSAHCIPTENINTLSLRIGDALSNCGTHIRGLTLIQEGVVFSSCYEKQVTCIDDKGSHVFTIKTTTDAYDLVHIPREKKIAVSSGGNPPYQITLIDVMKRKTINTSYSLPSYIYGMVLEDSALLCAVQNIGIYSIATNKESNTPKEMTRNSNINLYSYIASFKGKVYYTNGKTNTVTCCKNTGEVIWLFKEGGVLKGPAGIAVDMKGFVFVYVAGKSTSNVVAISPDGTNFKQLLTKDHGLVSPMAIHFSKTTSELLVANQSNLIFRCSIRYT